MCVCLYECLSAGGVCVELAEGAAGSVSTSSTSQKETTALGLPQHGGRDALFPSSHPPLHPSIPCS